MFLWCSPGFELSLHFYQHKEWKNAHIDVKSVTVCRNMGLPPDFPPPKKTPSGNLGFGLEFMTDIITKFLLVMTFNPLKDTGNYTCSAAATSHLYHRSKAITSVRTYRTSWSITRSFPCPSGSHQPSSNRLAPPERPITSNLAPYHRVWPATDQPWPQLGVASRTRSFQMAFSCGYGYAHRWACHLMMMMMNIQQWSAIIRSMVSLTSVQCDTEKANIFAECKFFSESCFSTTRCKLADVSMQ